MATKEAMLEGAAEGLAAGAIATTAMSAFMEGWIHLQRAELREPIPPRVVARTLAGRGGLWAAIPESVQDIYVWLSHYGYGSTMALAYRATEGLIPIAGDLQKGAAFGTAVWAAGYAGWLPALGLLQPPTRKPIGRIALVLGAHLVWGASLGLASRLMRGRFVERQTVERFEQPALARRG